LAEWIIELDAQGFSPSHPRVREMALRILQINGDAKPLGKNWTTSFLRRNPRVATCIGQKIEHLRIKCSQPELMKAFYARQELIRANYPLTPGDIWNMDEHGIGLGVCTNHTVIGEAGKKHTYVQTPENRD